MNLTKNPFVLALLFCVISGSSAYAEDEAADTQAKIQVGQTWTYDQSDLITHAPTQHITWTVTETDGKTYTLKGVGSNGNAVLDVFDADGNGIQYGAFKYAPNDATGLPKGAKAGATWKKSFTWRNSDRGDGGKADASGTCPGIEHITVPAGEFDALKCVITMHYRASNSGPVIFEDEVTIWHVPETLNYAKRDYVEKQRGHISLHRVEELSDYDLDP